MAIAVPDFSDESKTMKKRAKYAYTYEAVAMVLGIQDEIINIHVDPTREIVSFMCRTERTDERYSDFEVPEGQEVYEITTQCPELYGDIRCIEAKHHTIPHRFRLQDGWQEIPV